MKNNNLLVLLLIVTIIALLSVAFLSSKAAEGDSLWLRLYDGGGYEYLDDMELSFDNCIYLAGDRVVGLNCDLWIVKTDLQGNPLWSQAFGTNPWYIYFHSMISISDGGIYLVGAQYQMWYHNPILMFRIDAQGNTLWNYTNNNGGRKEVCKAITTVNGDLIVGYNYKIPSDYGDILLSKSDSTGHILWAKRYGTQRIEIINDFISENNGEMIIAGYISSPSGWSDSRALMFRINNQGDTLWSRTYSNHPDGVVVMKNVLSTNEGGYLLNGESAAGAWIIRTDSVGNSVWSNTYGENSADKFDFTLRGDEGSFLLAGTKQSQSIDLNDIWLMKIDEQGNVVNERTYGLYGFNEDLTAIIAVNDGGYLLCGARWEPGSDPIINFWLIKTDALGDSLWSKIFTQYVVCDLQQTFEGNYLIAGNVRQGGSPEPDFFLLCLEGPPSSISNWGPQKENIPLKSNIIINPNPFNTSTEINYHLRWNCFVKLKVFSTTGRLVKSLVNDFRNAGNYNVIFDGSDLPSGVYLVQFEAGETIGVKKIILLK